MRWVIQRAWIWWQFWRLDDEDAEEYESYHYEELERAFDDLGLGDESDDDSGSHSSGDSDGVEMLEWQLEDEEIIFDIQMYQALSGSKPDAI